MQEEYTVLVNWTFYSMGLVMFSFLWDGLKMDVRRRSVGGTVTTSERGQSTATQDKEYNMYSAQSSEYENNDPRVLCKLCGNLCTNKEE